MAVQPGQKFDRYAIEELVGEGGMGRVYRAFDTRLERRVALKVLHAAAGDAAESVAIALREARAAAAIAHPNATAIYDAHEIDGTSFIAMEFVAGTSLRTLINGAHVPLPTRLRWLIDVAAALAAAHRMGVVHRDVKPENVMVRHDGLVKVLDFGVARRIVIDAPADGTPVFHLSGARIAGTPAYMAPEQIRGEDIDGRADQFSWGVLAYEMLTGHLPWRTARDVVGYIAAVVSEEAAPPSAIAPEVPPAVDAAVLRALDKIAQNRFPGMLAAAAELARFARGSLSMEAVAPPASLRMDTPEGDRLSDPGSDPTVALADLDGGVAMGAGQPGTPGPAATSVTTGEAPSRSPAAAPGPSSGVKPAAFAPGTTGQQTVPSPAGVPSQRTASRSPAAEGPRSSANEPAPSSSRPAPRSSGSRARSSHEAVSPARAPSRRRWPFGSGFHEPDFEAPIDLEAHLALIPPEATTKGLFLADTLQQACKVTSETEILRAAQLGERRYIGFRDYPLAETLRLTVAAARVLYPRYPVGEGLRRVGQTVFDALLGTHVGRTIFGALGREVEPLLLSCPKAFKLLHSAGQMTCDKTTFRTFTLRATAFPAFLETYQVGVLEGVVRYCGERGRIRVAIDDLATATFELRLL